MKRVCVSVHGANRLGSNSLLDLIVFGRAASYRASELLSSNRTHKTLRESSYKHLIDRFESIRSADGDHSTFMLRNEMQHIMQKHAAVFRDKNSLSEGMELMIKTHHAFQDLKISDRGRIWNTDLIEALELDNMRTQAIATIASALNREESRDHMQEKTFQKGMIRNG